MSKIEWTDKTWNPITGCSKFSKGCIHCYAETMAKRLMAMGVKKYNNAFTLTLHNDCLKEPFKWKKQHNVFVCSMSDIFHEDVPFDFVDKIFEIIKVTPQHNYQILTKRAERMFEYFKEKKIPKNVWLGVTIESNEYKNRIDFLRDINAHIKFISCEPLLSDLGIIDLTGIDWVIVGGESGLNARPMKEDWVINIKKQVDEKGIAFFFKQWGTWGSDGVKRNKFKNGKLLRGQIYQEYPIK